MKRKYAQEAQRVRYRAKRMMYGRVVLSSFRVLQWEIRGSGLVPFITFIIVHSTPLRGVVLFV